MIKENLIS